MRFSSISYLLREGFRSIWQNRVMAVAAIGVLLACLILTGGSYLVFVNVNHAFDTVYEQNVVVAYANIDATDKDIQSLKEQLEGVNNVRSVEYMSKDQILERYKDSFSTELFDELKGKNNPMQDAFLVTFNDLAQYDATVWQIQALSLVESVSSSAEIAKTLTQLRNIVLLAGGWIIVLLLLVSLFIIANTIKLTVYARRLEIGIMKSVGATNTFIRVPFMVEGMSLGLIAGLLAFGITYFVYNKLETMFTISAFTSMIPFGKIAVLLLIAYIIAGVVTGMVGSAISMNRYLRDEGRSVFE
ncbi:MAG: permease-like cell division protein FtsX [Clostridia bacterium]|nr:permease-like cell division protein FtsX [Clostridia bacterium]